MPTDPRIRWRSTPGRVAVLAACVAVAAGCARLERFTREVGVELELALAKPLHYRLVGADPAVRKPLDDGRQRLKAGDHRGAVAALNRALWDIERLDNRGLRLAELAEIHDTLATAYAAQQRPGWADEHRRIAERVRAAAEREAVGTWPQALTRARAAWLGARFPEALTGWRDLLVELEDVADSRFRLSEVETARCYLALTHFALGDEERVRDELQRLAALDASVARCRREAPPSMRVLMSEISGPRRDLN